MFAFVRGTLVEKGRDRVNVLVDGGVGYEIFICQSERDQFPSTGNEVTFFTHLHVREDKMKLYGFINRSTRDFFRDLLPQKGIGPKLALSVLSDLGADAFRTAIHQQDTDALMDVKGVGKKTAKRLIVEMSEKLPKAEEGDGYAGDPIYNEAIQALQGLGFSQEQSSDAVRNALDQVADGSPELEDVIGLALSELEGN
jgi:Holliday junction DNA helicase RuvA